MPDPNTPSSLADMAALMAKDNSNRLNQDDYADAVNAALAEYSRHKPLEIVIDIPGNGTHDYNPPTGWIFEFSNIRQVEYPASMVPASYLEKDCYEIYHAPDGEKIRLLTATPSSLETVRITFTVPRTEATVPVTDLDAVSHLAAAHALIMLANRYLDTSDPLIAADTVNYKDKSDIAARRAKELAKNYREHLGIKEDEQVPAASVSADMSLKYPGGSDRLTHARWANQRR